MPHQYGRWDPNGVPVSTILGFVDKRESEARDLQFKSADIAEDANQLRNQLAANVSALANGMGGLLVIGIEHARFRGEDIAKGWRCTTAQVSSDRIISLLQGSVDPPFDSRLLNGLVVAPFACPTAPSQSGCGVLVPQSDGAPHQVAVGADAGKYLVATAQGLTYIHHGDLVTLIRGKPATLEFGPPTATKHVQGTDPSGERDVAFELELTVTSLGPGTVRDAQVRQWGPGVAADPPPVPLPPGTLHEGVPTQVKGLETVHAARPHGRRNTLVYQTQCGQAVRTRVERRAEEGAVLQYSCVCQVVGDRGRSPLLAIRFTTELGQGGIWGEPVVTPEEIAKEDVLAHIYLR
jgi:hypothetical protein